MISRRLGASLVISRIADLDIKRDRGIKVSPSILTRDPSLILNNPGIDIVIELTGDPVLSGEYIIQALRGGKQVVTANKALLAERGKILFKEAEEHNRGIFFEASVGGGIPIIKVIREGLAANKLTSILGIINGTTNYILSRMTEEGISLKTALAEAQQNGYAEKNPSLDLNGLDSAHKLVLLSSLAFGGWAELNKISIEGIDRISAEDISFTNGLGFTIKLLAVGKQTKAGVDLRVHPTLVSHRHLLASVNGVYNAVYLEGNYSDPQLFQGKGAGQRPTASAVAADLMEAGKNILSGNYTVPGRISIEKDLKVAPISEIECRHYIRIPVIDQPGVLAKIANILGAGNISIASVIQRGRRKKGVVPVILMTHKAGEKEMDNAVKQISLLPIVKNPPLRLRVEG